MNPVGAAPDLRPRSGLLAVIVAYFLPVVGFAYVRRLGWGLAYVLLAPLVLLAGGRLGMPTTLAGFYAMAGAMLLVLVAMLVTVFRLARQMPEDASPRWYNRWFHYLWLAIASLVLGNWLFADWFVGNRGAVFGYETFRIPSTSMDPTLKPGDFVSVDARNGSLSQINRGDIVIYRPKAHPDQKWMARVVGLPGEAVAVEGNGASVSGKRLLEPYVVTKETLPVGIEVPFAATMLGQDEYFLMGDNRPNAEDSRFQGPIPREAIVGKLRTIWFSFDPTRRSVDFSRIGNLPITQAS